MSVNRAKQARRRPQRRKFRRRTRLFRPVFAALAALILIAAGIFYIGPYRRHMAYMQYPLRYEDLIVANAEQFGLDPWHVAAVVRCESSFRERALSEVGAMGLMQIMPDTGQWLAGKFDEEDDFTADSLYRPEINLKYGCWYLNWLMGRYEGNLTTVTAAYHAGHGTVDKWLEDPTVSADGKTLSRIPYSSTENYVGRVLKACGKYQELYDFSGDEGGA